jgi:hypothetical protein
VSLLTICQAVAEEVGVNAPSTIVGSTDRTAKQLLRLANRAGKIIAKKDWPVLSLEWTFTTEADEASYALPDDFGRMLSETAWDRTNYWQLRGSLSAQEWQIRKSALVTTATTRKRFRIKAASGVRKFFIDPTPDAEEELVFEYISTQWCQDSGGTGQTKFAADSDVARISEDLIELSVLWRFREAKGLDYEEARAEYDAQLDSTFAEDRVAPTLNLGVRVVQPYPNVPESGFGL